MSLTLDPGLYDILRLIGNILVHWATLAALVSVVLHFRVDWWRTTMGRHLMAYQTVVGAVLLLACLSIDLLAGTVWFAAIRVLVFIGVPLVLTQRVWLQIKAQREVRREIGKHREPKNRSTGPLVSGPDDSVWHDDAAAVLLREPPEQLYPDNLGNADVGDYNPPNGHL